ncbi:hypothetical protein [Nonlabens sp.]|uniref:hypothetical protein n=1 Tax=Nonlabens sp. TaxID=1888209 RepID=UPI003F69F823
MNVVEEIRQEKINAIEVAKEKNKQFEEAYHQIYQHKIVKISKNVSFGMVRVLLIVIAVILFVAALFCFFPGAFITAMEESGEYLTQTDKEEISLLLLVIGLIIITLSLFHLFLAYVIKSNNKKRTIIFKLSGLLEEILEYQENDIKEQKKRYEVYVDEHLKTTK